MSLPIRPISVPTLTELAPAQPPANPTGLNQTSFQDVLSSAVQHVETAASGADQAAQDFVRGGTQELHSTILATQSAELDFELLMQVRNKMVSAYEEIMKMPV